MKYHNLTIYKNPKLTVKNLYSFFIALFLLAITSCKVSQNSATAITAAQEKEFCKDFSFIKLRETIGYNNDSRFYGEVIRCNSGKEVTLTARLDDNNIPNYYVNGNFLELDMELAARRACGCQSK